MTFGTRRARPAAGERSTDSDAAREAALRLLERALRTRFDLTRKLGERGFAEATISDVLDRLEGVGLVDDVEFARAFLAGRWGRRAAGWRRLEAELRGRGVAPDAIARAREQLEERVGAVDEVAAARRVIEQSARRYAALDPRRRRQWLWALLMRRGFDGDVIERALRENPPED
ncbi:MAG: regulatory protein RecX [Candidatus Eisenbacteria bacterium]|nr:regulatory protein RecX [Candidatus Eisenbacteria bacterium]